MKVLLTGANGQVGRCFQDRVPHNWQLVAVDRNSLDITDRIAVNLFIQKHRPDVIVNAAAYTAVDKAESEPDIVEKINTQGPYNLALASAEIGAKFFHISTDYVFDGTKEIPYTETDIASPINIYGKTKLAGENLSLIANLNTVIIRTSWVFSEYGNNFVKTMLKLAKDKTELSIIADQFGCPTYAGNLVDVLIAMIQKKGTINGIYHYSDYLVQSWFEFASTIIAQASSLEKLPHPVIINAIATEGYPTLAKRPKNSVLDCSKIEKEGIIRANYLNSLDYVINKLL